MKKLWPALLATAIMGSAYGQASSVIYAAGKMIKDQSIDLMNWGSGSIAESTEQGLEGNRSIRVSTRNFFQGGVMDFDQPVDLSTDYDNKNNLLRITFRLAGEDLKLVLEQMREGRSDDIKTPGNTFVKGGSPGGGGAAGGKAGGGKAGAGGAGKPGGGAAGGGKLGGGAAGGGKLGGGGGMLPGGGTKGGKGGGMGSPGMPGGGAKGGFPGMGGNKGSAKEFMKVMRVIITTTDGKHAEAYLPLTSSTINDRLWREVSIPLQAINGLDQTNRQIKEIALSGDKTQTFWVGEMKVVNDQTPITGDLNTDDLNLALGDTVTLIARGYGGSSILKYTWDFDDKDGIQIDAEGQLIKHKFRTPGTYTISCTISDAYGLKEPVVKTFKVKVNP